jgi:uncharacterized protein (TIGR02588 family)
MNYEQTTASKLQKNRLEWSIFALSLALVIGTLGYLTWAAWTQGGEPAQLEVTLGQAQQRRKHFAVPVSVTNRGDQTAEGVMVEVLLKTLKGVKWKAPEYEVALVPRQSTRRGEAIFKHDPRTSGQVTGRVLGYEIP